MKRITNLLITMLKRSKIGYNFTKQTSEVSLDIPLKDTRYIKWINPSRGKEYPVCISNLQFGDASTYAYISTSKNECVSCQIPVKFGGRRWHIPLWCFSPGSYLCLMFEEDLLRWLANFLDPRVNMVCLTRA